MDLMKLEHIGIAVKSIDAGIEFWSNIVGFKLHGITQVEAQKVKVAVLEGVGVKIELIESTSPDSPIMKFIENRGEGLHHICFEVKNIESALSELKANGIKLIDESPRLGAFGKKIAFLHPSSCCGVLIEIAEKG